MKFRPTLLFLGAALAFASSFTPAFAEAPAPSERIAASYLLALGRLPSAAEIEPWRNEEKILIRDLVARLQQQLQKNPDLQQATRVKAFEDAFGRAPRAGEIDVAGGADTRTYTEWMNRHIQQLAAHADDYREVLDRAYRLVVRRGVYEEEVAYWKARETLSYALLVGCIEDWARRNQPGLMVTAGTATVSINSNYLTTVRLPPAIAEEARAVVGLPTADTDYFRYGSSRTVIAAGAGDVVSGGRIHFVAAGADNLLPDRAGS